MRVICHRCGESREGPKGALQYLVCDDCREPFTRETHKASRIAGAAVVLVWAAIVAVVVAQAWLSVSP